MGKCSYLLFLWCFVGLISCQSPGKPNDKKAKILNAAAISAIKDTAKTNLINFITVIKINGAYNKDFNFAVKYKSAQNARQYVWAKVFAMQNDSFKCVVVTPGAKGLPAKPGDTILLSQDQVEDWKMEDKVRGNKFGNYTQQYLNGKL